MIAFFLVVISLIAIIEAGLILSLILEQERLGRSYTDAQFELQLLRRKLRFVRGDREKFWMSGLSGANCNTVPPIGPGDITFNALPDQSPVDHEQMESE